MQYFIVKPEVAGGLGEHTSMDGSTHPPEVTSLHYVFDGWSGDVLLTSFPCYIVTPEARKELERMQVTGASFAPVEISKSETFDELFPGRELPKFSWLRVDGVAGVDDFGIAKDLRLTVSKRVLDVLSGMGLREAVITKYE